MTDMLLLYGKYDRQPRKTARMYALTYPERKHPDHVFFIRLESRMRKFGQFKPVKRPGTYIMYLYDCLLIFFYFLLLFQILYTCIISIVLLFFVKDAHRK
ncbi:hypothetical protein X777_13806 [Ooceraea biroi]|uniref:DUF4817 domain-containing protein n=1 Tax=Ooceraea biroi TaxID=2015173 RepID=A0A026VY67_OOCBI|nr:hypothetical protein X777_13806 [Ooceraea biroi]